LLDEGLRSGKKNAYSGNSIQPGYRKQITGLNNTFLFDDEYTFVIAASVYYLL